MENTTLNKKLFEAIDVLDLDAVLDYIEKGADVNALDEDGETPITKLILVSRFNAVDSSFDKMIALVQDQKIRDKIFEVKNKLELGGRDLTTKYMGDDFYCYILKVAEFSETERLSFIKRLVKLGADINLCGKGINGMGDAAIKNAVMSGQSEVVEYLINTGADLNIVYDEDGVNPISILEISTWDLAVAREKPDYFVYQNGILINDDVNELYSHELQSREKIVDLIERYCSEQNT